MGAVGTDEGPRDRGVHPSGPGDRGSPGTAAAGAAVAEAASGARGSLPIAGPVGEIEFQQDHVACVRDGKVVAELKLRVDGWEIRPVTLHLYGDEAVVERRFTLEAAYSTVRLMAEAAARLDSLRERHQVEWDEAKRQLDEQIREAGWRAT